MTQDCSTSDPQVTSLSESPGSFRVESRTRPGLVHTVNVPESTCTCEAGQHHIDCWHLDFCRAVYYWHRYDTRAQLLAERVARVQAAKTTQPARLRPRERALLQDGYPISA